jgi:OmpA-OmpF porin, OOP family
MRNVRSRQTSRPGPARGADPICGEAAGPGFRQTVAIAVIGVAVGATLAACGGATQTATANPCGDPGGDVVIAASARANAPWPQAQFGSILSAYAETATTNQRTVSVVSTDGVPQVVTSQSFKSDAANPQAAKDELAPKQNQLLQALMASRAQSAEANPLNALNVAARLIRGSGQPGTVVLLDSGLQTTGALDYTAGLLGSDPEIVANQLAHRGQLPDLSGVNVIVLGVGDVSAPQEPLDTAQQTNLREQWQAIAKESGAACVHIDQTPVTGSAQAGLPRVAVVKVPQAQAIAPGTRVVISDTAVKFVSDSAQLVDPASARRALSRIADDVKTNTRRVLLTGTTATDGTEAGRLELSRQRAETVKSLLVQQGVPAANIETNGVGTHNPEHVNDVDGKGNLVESLAAQNRNVILTVVN